MTNSDDLSKNGTIDIHQTPAGMMLLYAVTDTSQGVAFTTSLDLVPRPYVRNTILADQRAFFERSGWSVVYEMDNDQNLASIS